MTWLCFLLAATFCVGVFVGFVCGCIVGFRACGALLEEDLRRLRARVQALVALRRRRLANLQAWYPDASTLATLRAMADRREKAGDQHELSA